MNELLEIFPWNENFATGFPQIDEQHQRLVQLLNRLASSLAYQSDIHTLSNIFNELAEYAVYHFQTEENVWHQFLAGDAWEAAHKKAHENFVSDVLRLKDEEKSKSLSEVFEEVVSFLTHWLVFHILETDKRMSMVALAVQSGMPLEQAKQHANQQMTGSMKVMIETILSMYDTLASRTLQLMKEVIDRQKAEAKLRLAANVIENTLEAICITDADTNVIDVNPAFYETSLYSPIEVIGKNLKTLKLGLEDEKLSSRIWDAVADQGHWSGEILSRTKSGEIDIEWLTLSSIKDEHGAISNYVAVFTNIVHLIQQRHELERIANHDALTGLPNRLLLSDRLELAIAHAERTRSILAVCNLDLDGFKPVNDHYGHAAGDLVLKEVAQRLLKVIRGNDTVARLGGDEFVILFVDLKAQNDFMELLDSVLQDIARPIQIQNENVFIAGSIGVTLFPQDNGKPDALMEHADQAMYEAKRLGKSQYHLWQGNPGDGQHSACGEITISQRSRDQSGDERISGDRKHSVAQA